MEQDNKQLQPLWQLTLVEFREILREEIRQISLGTNPNENKNSEKKYVYGLDGIATLLGCSVPTASRIKRSGILDRAITQIGRKIVVDAELALELIKDNEEEKKRKKNGKSRKS